MKFDENIEKHIETINDNRIKVLNSIDEESLSSFLSLATDNDDLLLDFKDLDEKKLLIVFKYAMENVNKSSPLITLNLFNLLKTYNTMDESFFDNKDIYFKNLIQMVDVKLDLENEIKEFLKKYSMYFLSLIKCYNKLSYTPLETVTPLPKLFQVLFSMMDFGTAAGIFSRSPAINTDETLQLENAYEYLGLMLVKTGMSINFLADFYNEEK